MFHRWLELTNTKNGRQLFLYLETPFLAWSVDLIGTLPDGQVILQIGTNQICILDPETRKMAILAKGPDATVTVKSTGQSGALGK
jgi:hypothetical protein